MMGGSSMWLALGLLTIFAVAFALTYCIDRRVLDPQPDNVIPLQ